MTTQRNITPYEKQGLILQEIKETITDRLAGLMLGSPVKEVREYFAENDLVVDFLVPTKLWIGEVEIAMKTDKSTDEDYLVIETAEILDSLQAGIAAVLLNAFSELNDIMREYVRVRTNYDKFKNKTISSSEHDKIMASVLKEIVQGIQGTEKIDGAEWYIGSPNGNIRIEALSVGHKNQEYAIFEVSNEKTGCSVGDGVQIDKEDVEDKLRYFIDWMIG